MDSFPPFKNRALPDYSKPDAIMVPHYKCSITPLLEEIVQSIAPLCGVILLSPCRTLSEEFVAMQNYSHHYSVITASFDTPWIRDRSPFAIATENGIVWCLPQVGIMDGRPYDDVLFSQICSNATFLSPIDFLPQGNMVVGDEGVTFVTDQVLILNQINISQLNMQKEKLGVKKWIVFSGFENEVTGHADVHVRSLGPKLIAVAWNLSSEDDRKTIQSLIDKIRIYDKSINILRIPIRSSGKKYASLVNWIQIGSHIIIPRYDLTTKEDINDTTKLFEKYHFTVEYIYSPTLEEGGSLHCLSASIYVADLPSNVFN